MVNDPRADYAITLKPLIYVRVDVLFDVIEQPIQVSTPALTWVFTFMMHAPYVCLSSAASLIVRPALIRVFTCIPCPP